MQKLNRENFV